MADLVDDLTLNQREIEALRGAPVLRVLSYTATPDGVSPSAGGVGGGSADPGGAREATLKQVRDATQALKSPLGIVPLTPQPLTVSTVAIGLPDLGAANEVTVHVVSGSVRRSIGGTPSSDTPVLNAGDSEKLKGGELTAYKLVRDGNSDAILWLESRVVG